METTEDRNHNEFITVFDLDGCISDDRWRSQRVPKDAKTAAEWTHYHEGCGDDMPLDTGAALLREHIKEGDFILFATGRPFTYADKTSEWIQRHFKIEPFKDFTILMRKPDDERPSIDLKNEFITFIARHAMESKKQIRIAYDDKADVVDLYNKSGIKANVLNAVGLHTPETAQAIQEDVAQVERILTQDRLQTLLTEAPRTDYMDVPAMLRDLATMFEAKNQVYGNSGLKVGAVMAALFPDGWTLNTEAEFRMFSHLERVVAKLVRFVNSDLTHKDSIQDLAVYAAMCAAEVQ